MRRPGTIPPRRHSESDQTIRDRRGIALGLDDHLATEDRSRVVSHAVHATVDPGILLGDL